MLRQFSTTLAVDTPDRGLHEITRDVAAWVTRSGINEGLLTLFVRHTSASLLIQENAEPDVRSKVLALGMVPMLTTAAEMKRRMAADIPRWTKVARDNGIQAE